MRPRPRAPQQKNGRFPVRAAHQTKNNERVRCSTMAPSTAPSAKRQLGAVHKGWRSVAIRERRWARRKRPQKRALQKNIMDPIRPRNGQNLRRVFSCTETAARIAPDTVSRKARRSGVGGRFPPCNHPKHAKIRCGIQRKHRGDS